MLAHRSLKFLVFSVLCSLLACSSGQAVASGYAHSKDIFDKVCFNGRQKGDTQMQEEKEREQEHQEQMALEKNEFWNEDRSALESFMVPIRPAKHPLSLPRFKPSPNGGMKCSFGNEKRNSRVDVPLGSYSSDSPAFELRWRADLAPSLEPYELLAANDRIIVHGAMQWQLFDMRGRGMQTVPLGPSGITLDPSQSLIYAADVFGRIIAYHFHNGQPAFIMLLNHGKDFGHPFLVRKGHRIISTGVEIPRDPSAPLTERTNIEVTELHNPAARKSWDEPGGPLVLVELVRKSMYMEPALSDDVFVLATKDRVYLFNLDLQLQSALTGTFLPAALSLDEAMNIYMIVYVQGGYALWLLTPDGEQVYSFVFPPGVKRPRIPPIVGYDHTVYLVADRQVLSVAVDGKLNWMHTVHGEMTGAAITVDDQLLVTEDASLVAWDAAGRRRVLFTLPSSQIATPPVLLPTGEVLIADKRHLYCLAPIAGANNE